MLHTPNIQMAELAAIALEIPIVLGRTKGEKEYEVRDIEATILEAKRKFDFTFLASGGLASEYQRSRLAQVAKATELTSMNPLWGIDQKRYVVQLAQDGYRFILTAVAADGLDEKWLGREMDVVLAEKLVSLSEKFRFNPALEGGEGETLVLDCPLYSRQRIEIVEAEKTWDGYRGRLEIKKARLIPKLSSVATAVGKLK